MRRGEGVVPILAHRIAAANGDEARDPGYGAEEVQQYLRFLEQAPLACAMQREPGIACGHARIAFACSEATAYEAARARIDRGQFAPLAQELTQAWKPTRGAC